MSKDFLGRELQPYEALEANWGITNGFAPDEMAVCSSGTAALHLALEVLKAKHGWPDGAEVLVPDFTFVACARAVVLAGLTPVFVDCGPDLLMDCSLLWPESGKVGDSNNYSGVVAMMPVHIYGRRCDMERVYEFARPRGIAVIEDCAEFHFGKRGELSDAWCWSFQESKIVHGEEGGAVAFRDSTSAEMARTLRTLGHTNKGDYTHIPRGHNYRLANSLAEKILTSLVRHQTRWVTLLNGRNVESLLEERTQLQFSLSQVIPSQWLMRESESPWVYTFRIPRMTAMQQENVIVGLRQSGTKARYPFRPMSTLEEFKGCRVVFGKIREADKACREIIVLPLTPGVNGGMSYVEYAHEVFDIVRESL